MKFHWTYTGCDKSDEEHIADAWRDRQAELESKADLLASDGTSQVRIAVEKNDAAPAWVIRAVLYAPEGTVAADSRENELITALDRLVAGLSQEIDRQAERPQTVEVRREGLASVAAVLKSFCERKASHEFFSFLFPVVQSLGPYTRRELRARQIREEIPVGQVTVRDVLDEAMLRAWDFYAERPPTQPLDLWLIGIIDDVLERSVKPVPEQSLEERQPRDETKLSESDKFEETEQVAEFESIELSQLIEDAPGRDEWDRLDAETRRSRLTEFFQYLPRRERQTLMLRAVEGFSEQEIADFQDRPRAAVQEDLVAAQSIAREVFIEKPRAKGGAGVQS